MVYLFGVIDNMRCVSHFPYLGPNYSKKNNQTKKLCEIGLAGNENWEDEGDIQRHTFVWLGGKIGHPG